MSTENTPTLKGKVALVTGASRGIGRGIALALAEAGADVVCAATTQANAQSIAEEISAMGRRSLACGAHVGDSAQVEQMFREAAEALGGVDILVNNAGIAQVKAILEMTPEDWSDVLNVNATSAFFCSQAAARRWQKQGRGGVIIHIGSIAGENAFPKRLAYCASKAALHHMTRVMAIEWAPLGIRVNCIAPGYIRTELIDQLAQAGKLDQAALEGRIPQRRLGGVEDIARAAVFLAGDGSSYTTGSILTVDGGWDAYGFV